MPSLDDALRSPLSTSEIPVRAHVQLAGFSPAEAEEITGVSRSVQRQWRQRGHLVETPGHHAIYNIFSMSRLLCLRLFGQCRRDLKDVYDVVEVASRAVAWRALSWPEAWSGDHREIGTWDAGWIEQAATRGDKGWHFQANLLRGLIFESKGFVPERQQYCVLWADGTHSFTSDLKGATVAASAARIRDRMFALDSYHAGHNLAALAGRPLAHCELEIAR